MESRPCPTLSRELFHPWLYTCHELTLYALLADQTATVFTDNCTSNFLYFTQVGISEKFRFSAEPLYGLLGFINQEPIILRQLFLKRHLIIDFVIKVSITYLVS